MPAGSGTEAAKALRKAPDCSQERGSDAGQLWPKVAVPTRYLSRSSEIERAEKRGITLMQVNELASFAQDVFTQEHVKDEMHRRLTWDEADLYVLNEQILSRLTRPFGCSFVELIADEPQEPRWFISHWWGTPFYQTKALLGFHSSQRQLNSCTPYWICTFANNQHDLSELCGELRETPFVKAILSSKCEGTLALLDQQVTTFERIWCVLENFVSTTWAADAGKDVGSHLYDIAAWLPHGTATFGGKAVPAKPTLRLDLCDGNMREVVEDEASGGAFPLMVSARGVDIDITKAKSSREDDRKNILHLIAETPTSSWKDDPPSSCQAFHRVNACARRMFVAGAMYRAALQDDPVELQRLLEDFPEAKNETIHDGATALYAASWKNNVSVLHILLKASVDIDKAKVDGATPVFVAAQAGNREALDALLAASADPNKARIEDCVTPVFMAVQNAHIEVLAALLQATADANVMTARQVAPLHLAVQKGNKNATGLLLKSTADPNILNQAGQSPLDIALCQGKEALARMLKTSGAKDVAKEMAREGSSSSLSASKNEQKSKTRGAKATSFSSAMASLDSQIQELAGLDDSETSVAPATRQLGASACKQEKHNQSTSSAAVMKRNSMDAAKPKRKAVK
eukprot:TRINITY_DN21893_c0_g3_i2.p1 TRINITY_DN21893_c0_g3~~TRINITY_DN21893_c0_g3_i2.p1  ORF type:complete len:632 (+),score=70.77 TRINITY_DN21893_c0_g3_i2:84-1979(+)